MEEDLFWEVIEGGRACIEIRKANEELIKLKFVLVIYFHEKRYDEAMDEVKALIGNPEMAEHKAYLTLIQGQISELQGKFDETLGFYCHAFAIGKWSPYVRYYLWNHIGFCWMLKNRFKGTERCCRRAIKIDPKRGGAWKNLGVCLEYQGRFIEALQCYFKAILLKIKPLSILRLRHHVWRAHMG